ncbi:MAG: hypothetical protein EBZ36_05500 [Acidobacteria bacterium]|nr:hypothetical protein [Acidobacteriota bacterium]
MILIDRMGKGHAPTRRPEIDLIAKRLRVGLTSIDRSYLLQTSCPCRPVQAGRMDETRKKRGPAEPV